MIVTPISHPLPGERLIGVEPPLNPTVDAKWQRRLNLYTGRALSDAALTTEQTGRAGRLATRGQMLSPGIINGLFVGLESPLKGIVVETIIPIDKDPEILRKQCFFHISAGAGIMPSGEDLILSRNIRVAVGDVPVYTTVELLTKIENPQDGPSPEPAVIPGRDLTARPAGPAVLKPRRLGPPLIDLVKAKAELPRASVLLLQPIVLKRVGEFDDEDPCEQDPQDYAFEDWLLVDGWQLILYPWPTELTDTLPLPADSSQWRNQLAYTIFEAEMNGSDPRATLPWEAIGLPIGLVGFDGDGLPEFVDRYAVVRSGGKPKRRSALVPDISDVIVGKESEDFTTINQYEALVPGAGHSFVWQARLQQFAEQLAESLGDNQSIAGVSDQFRFLPPAGLLPKDALTLDGGQIQNKFFPIRFDLVAVPVPLEQLDVAINQSASLSRFDANDLDRLRVLVPVPQIYYEPKLLEEEKGDPEFDQNIATSLRKLGKWMKRRFNVHDAGVEINREIKGRDAGYRELELMSDEERTINQNLPTDPNDPADPDDKELNTDEDKYDREAPPHTQSFNSLQDRLALGTVFPRKILEDTIKGVSIPNMCIELGLEGFIDYLEHKVKQADDIIDFGFVRVQTDIYRYRQLMMGTEAARLATSPALAAIAKGETALATKEEIIKFVRNAKNPNLTMMMAAGPLADSGSDEGPSSSKAGSGASLAASSVLGPFLALPEMHAPQSSAIKDTSAAITMQPITIAATKAVSTKQQNAATLFASPGTFTKADVTQQTAIVGRPLDFRTVTIAERIKPAPAPEAKDYTVSSKYEVLKALEELAKVIVIEDLVLPGLYHYDPVMGGGLTLLKETVRIFDKGGNPIEVERPKVSTQTFGVLMTNRVSAQVLSGLHDFDPDDGDESAFFAAAVRASDHTVAMLRVVEGRIQAYRNIIADCREVLSKLNEMATSVASRLDVIEGHLAEMRHDLAVARALKADEDLRVENINARRAEVLKEHVGFLAFCRERTTDPHDTDVKTRGLDPAMVESPVPACLARDVSPPPELHGMIDQLRDAPVKWFINVHPLLDKFDRLESLQRVVTNAKVRANLPPPVFIPPPLTNSPFANFGPAIGQLITMHQTVVSQLRVQTAQLDLSTFATQSWQVARDQAREVVSLGDLIEGSHGRGDVSQQAAREVANITHIASCLYSTLSVVLPVIRLNWAERISQFDAQVDLRNLGSLPRWGEIAYLDRREMQTYTDWLFSRIDRQQPEAISIINDTVRVCILLASHAPVNQIISAHVAQQTEVNEGGRVTLTVDPLRVRVGMHVLMYRSGQIAARGIIEDLSSSQAAARVVQVHNTSKATSVDPSDYVQIAEAGAFDRNPLALVRPK